jgi:vacuolar-type H+-ATPase subunit I/STV1
MIKQISLGLALILYSLLLFAQDTGDQDKDRQYVTDQLRLSLYERADSRSPVVKLLQSGDLLLIDELSGPYALVTAPTGERGWVKRGFLVSSPTSNILLREEQQKLKDLAVEIEKLNNSKTVIDQYEKDMDQLVEKIDLLETDSQNAAETISELQQEVEDKQQEIDRKDEDSAPAMLVLLDTSKRYWQILLPIFIGIIFLCFLVSKAIVEARIKSKFHGIKIW